jgi:hypothetical protein
MKSGNPGGLSALGAAAAVILGACGGSKLATHPGSGGSGTGGTATTTTSGTTGSTGGSGGGSVVYPPLPAPPAMPELWYWNQGYLSTTNPAEPAATMALIDQAVAAGYTGIALWDSAETFVTRPGWDTSTQKAVIAYATSKGLKILPSTAPYGYSNDLLSFDPNQAEGQRVVGSQFTVTGGQLVPINSLPPVGNTGFESGTAVWFSFGDAGLGVDTTTAHTGDASALFSPVSSNNQRLTTPLTLTPWRLYHLGFWVKTSGFQGGDTMVDALDTTSVPNTTLNLSNFSFTPAGTADWTRYDMVFNSRESTQILLLLGVWGGHQGDLWIDDIVLEETALVNVLRRDGTPVKVYDPSTQAAYTEGTDVAMIVDPAVAANGGGFDPYHAPPTISVPPGSKLAEGQTVAIDAYSVFPDPGGGVGVCLTEAYVHTWMHEDLADIAAIFPTSDGFFLGYDEMRHMNSCALCRQMNLTAGQLLAWNVGRSVAEVNAVAPGAPLYVWSDMFDPYQNAVDNYYSVEGTIAGSWAGLPPGIVMMNWNLGSLNKSLTWFAGKDPSGMQPHGFQQVIAGYYSNPAGGGPEAATEMAAAMGVPGIIGAMYTTWDGNYTQLQQYADGIRGAWAAYRASVAGP